MPNRLKNRDLSLPVRLALALAFVAAAMAVRTALQPWLGANVPLTFFVLATIATSVFLGFVPSLLSMVVGFTLAAYFFIEPRYQFGGKADPFVFNLLSFGVLGIVSAIIGHVARQQRVRLMLDAKDAEASNARLQASEDKLLFALQVTETATWDINFEQRDMIWSANAAPMFGLANGVTPSLDRFLTFIHPDDVGRVHESFLKAVEERRLFEADLRIIRPDGDVRWFYAKGQAQYRGFKALRASGVVMDVTERRAAQDAARFNERRTALAFRSAGIGSWQYDVMTAQVIWSPEMRELLGLDPQGQRDSEALWASRVHPEDLPKTDALWQRTLADPTADKYAAEHRIVRASDGAVRRVEAKGIIQRDGVGRALRVDGILVDVTEQREMTERLRSAKEAADTANQAKSAFLANMSHEIRTPLNAIMGFSEILLDPSLSGAERQDCVATISRNGRMLARLIDDILDLSKVEAGKLEVTREAIAVSGVLVEVSQVLADMARRNAVVLSVESEPGVPDAIQSDPVRLRQILLNVVGNAVKFTRDGVVRVRARVLAEPKPGEVCLGFEVIDEGPGIAVEHQVQLFRPFQQTDASTTRRFGGTGLGLALSRRLARALGGDVELMRSRSGEGSTFLVSIQAGRQEALVAPKAAVASLGGPSLDGYSVLVVEDTPDSQYLIKRILAKAGAEVATAQDGAEGVRLATARDFDLVLMDIQMPLLDGYQATAELRRQGYSKPIVALTAHAMKEEREKTLRCGFSDHVTKPINPRSLIETVASHIRAGMSADS